jgi:hypothetical protein
LPKPSAMLQEIEMKEKILEILFDFADRSKNGHEINQTDFEDVAKKIADGLGEATKEAGWISVNDRLPAKEFMVIVYMQNIVIPAYCKDGIFLIPGAEHITHWMPFPTPPTSEGMNV